MKLNDMTSLIIGFAIKVHRVLGPGLLESAYRVCLAYEQQKLGLRVADAQRRTSLRISYSLRLSALSAVK
jgi:GxxExxY protein